MTKMLMNKSSNDFANRMEWRNYVRIVVPDDEVDYVLAFDRTQLLLCFYKLRGMKPPTKVKAELDRIAKLNEPERTDALEALNDLLLATATIKLMAACKSHKVANNQSDPAAAAPRAQIDTLLEHLGNTSPCYRLWRHYTGAAYSDGRIPWEKYVARLHSRDHSKSAIREEEYELLMGRLAQLLAHYRDNNLSLPPLSFERIWYLDRLRGPERNLQARAVVQGLIEAMKPCASA